MGSHSRIFLKQQHNSTKTAITLIPMKKDENLKTIQSK